MPKLIPRGEFDELVALADALLARSREVVTAEGDLAVDAAEDVATATIEVQAFSMAMMALATACPLMPAPLFVAMGSAIGIILAQQTDPHPVLLDALRQQTKASYNDIVEAQRPQGRA